MDVCYDVLGDPLESLLKQSSLVYFAFWPKETEGNFYMGKVMRKISSLYKISL